MSVDMYQGKRSKESIQFEALISSEGHKESFSSIEKPSIFLIKKELKTRSLM